MLQITNTKDENKGTKPNFLTSAQGPFHPPFPSVSSPRYILPASFLFFLYYIFLYTTTRTIFIFFWLDDLLYCIMFSREAEEKGHTLINLCNNLDYFFNGAFRKRPKVKVKIGNSKIDFFNCLRKFFILYCKSIANLFPFFDHFLRKVFMLD